MVLSSRRVWVDAHDTMQERQTRSPDNAAESYAVDVVVGDLSSFGYLIKLFKLHYSGRKLGDQSEQSTSCPGIVNPEMVSSQIQAVDGGAYGKEPQTDSKTMMLRAGCSAMLSIVDPGEE